jgi:hypothetical protein
MEFKHKDPDDPDLTTKVKIPIAGPNSSKEDLLLTIHHFKRAVPALRWTSGPKKFRNFSLCLSDSLLDRWDTLSESAVTQTNNTFNDILDTFVRRKIPQPDALDAQKEHMMTIRKRRDISVEHFAERLEALNLLIPELPDAEDVDKFTDDELKRILFNAMPQSFRTEFRKTNKLNDLDFDQLHEKMILYEELFPAPSTNMQGNNSPNQGNSKNYKTRTTLAIVNISNATKATTTTATNGTTTETTAAPTKDTATVSNSATTATTAMHKVTVEETIAPTTMTSVPSMVDTHGGCVSSILMAATTAQGLQQLRPPPSGPTTAVTLMPIKAINIIIIVITTITITSIWLK